MLNRPTPPAPSCLTICLSEVLIEGTLNTIGALTTELIGAMTWQYPKGLFKEILKYSMTNFAFSTIYPPIRSCFFDRSEAERVKSCSELAINIALHLVKGSAGSLLGQTLFQLGLDCACEVTFKDNAILLGTGLVEWSLFLVAGVLIVKKCVTAEADHNHNYRPLP